MADRQQHLAEQEEKKSLERQKAEYRLDQLRSTVRKEASFDLSRTFGDTEASYLLLLWAVNSKLAVFSCGCLVQQASRARFEAGRAMELALQQPLFSLYGFTAEKVVVAAWDI